MKTYKYWHLCLALLLSIGCLSYAQNNAAFELKDDEKLIEFTTDRFTLPNLHVTPDGKNIIFDVFGDIYQVPIEGGKAEVLLQDNNWKRAGKLSPDGETLAYVSDETGEFQVWTLNLKTREKKVYPTKETLHYPLYSFWDKDNNLIIPDKKGILSYNKNGEKTILRETKKDERSILNAIPQQISLDKNGEVAYIIKKPGFLAFNMKKREESEIEISNLNETKAIDFYRFNNSGKGFVGYKYDKNRVNILFYQSLEQNGVKNLIELESTGYSTNLHHSFDFINDTTIVLDKEGQIVKMNLETGEYKPIPIEVDIKKIITKPLRREPQYIRDTIITASVLRNPITRPGLDTIYFGSFGKLHSFAKETGVITEIYPKEDRFEVSPSLSSDGSYLAYTTWNDNEMGHVYAREIKTGKEYQLTKEPGRYLNPVWASDRRSLVYLSDETLRTEGSLKAPPNSGHLMHLNEMKISKNKLRVTSINKIVEVVVVSPQPNRYFSPISYDKSENGVYILNKNLNRKGKKNIPELMHVDLKSRKFTSSTELPHNIDEALVSPDEKQVAFIHDNQIWINNYPFMPEYVFSENSDLISKVHHTYGGYVESVSLPQTAKTIYEIAPSYLFWKDKNTLMWGSANEVYIYDVRTNKTQKIADINAQKPRAIPKTLYALTNARVITMNKEDKIIEDGIVLVKENRIEAVGKVGDIKIPNTYKVIDLKGKSIIPGLIDVHAHYISDPHEMQFHNNYLLLSNLAYGVTSIYDPSVNTLDYRDISQMVETGQIIGPRIFASGNIIMDKPGQYDYKQIKNYQDAERIVLSFRKLRVSGPIKEYSISNRNKRKWLREAAEKHNYSITTDQVNYIPAITRVFDGYSSIEHLIGLFNIQKDVLSLISYSKIDYTPTLITKNFSSLIYGNPKWKDEYCNDRVLINGDNVYQTKSEFLGGCLNLLKNSYLAKNEEREQFLKDQINLIKYIINNGGKVSVGAHGTYKAGINTHWELWAYTRTGLDNYKALKTATINGAEKLSLDKEIGSIEKGKLADLVILNSNPIDHIYNTADVDYTIINGKKYQVK